MSRSPPKLSGIEAFVDERMAGRIGDEIPGATVAVIQGDDVVLAKGYGHADVEAGMSVRASETVFRIGSVSKLVTWTAVMQGVEDGELDLDADVNTYLGDSPVKIPDTYEEPVTLRHLGTHTAGFDFIPNPGVVDDADALTRLETALVDNQPDRIRPPGEAVGYSNYGAMLAGHVVAEAYDTTFEEYVQSEVLDPLGMDHSTFVQPVPDDNPGTLARPHAPGDGTFETPDPVYINWRPAGSMSATATDMAAFMSAHLGDGGGVLAAETAETMHRQQYQRHPAVNNWRYGFYEYGHPDGSVIAHSGSTIYYTSWLGLVPDHDVGIFVNFNTRTEETPVDVGDEILAEYDLQPELSAPEPASEPGTRERAETVAGEYRATVTPQNGDLQVLGLLSRLTVGTTDDGRLVTSTLQGERRKWIETEPYVYRRADGEDVLAVDVTDGRVDALHLNSQPQNTFEPVTPLERQTVMLGTMGASVGGFALSLAGWGGLGAWRAWRRRRTDADTDVASADGIDGPEGESS